MLKIGLKLIIIIFQLFIFFLLRFNLFFQTLNLCIELLFKHQLYLLMRIQLLHLFSLNILVLQLLQLVLKLLFFIFLYFQLAL